MMNLKYSKDPIRVVIYARVSSDAQDIINSITAQIAECEQFARNNNMVVVAIYIEEAESGRSDNRPQFQQMVADATGKDKPFEVQDDCKVRRLDRRGGRWSALGGRRRSWLAGAWTSGGETILPGAGRSARC